MIKGWRNNPAWVAYYEAKKQTQTQQQIERQQQVLELAKLTAQGGTWQRIPIK